MAKLKISLIGAGGTGAWFGRALAHAVTELEAEIVLDLYDPDTIELKNLLRQPFVGAECVGTPKVDYLKGLIDNVATATEIYLEGGGVKLQTNAHMQLVQEVAPIMYPGNEDAHIVVLAVDNTYTRMQFELWMAQNRRMLVATKTFYIDGGTNDVNYAILACPACFVPVVNYDSTTFPDQMLSCGDLAGQNEGYVQQTTHQNMMCGAQVARMTADIIKNVLSEKAYYGEYYASEDNVASKYTGDVFKDIIRDLDKDEGKDIFD